VTVGRARSVVIGIGSKTAMGKIRDAMSESVAVSICISFANLVLLQRISLYQFSQWHLCRKVE
jgi:hypothetical protein